MKYISLLLFSVMCSGVIAQPALSVLTINTEEQKHYHQWMRDNGPIIGKELGAMALGVCKPMIGAEHPNHLYAWSVGKSHGALLSAIDAMPMNKKVGKAVAKIAKHRTIEKRDLWSVVKAPSNPFRTGNVTYNWHVMVKTSSLMDYVKALNDFHQESHNNGFKDIDMAVYLGNSGQYTNTSMVVAYAPSAERLGAFFDERFAPWSSKYMGKFAQLRTMTGAFIMRCETVYHS